MVDTFYTQDEGNHLFYRNVKYGVKQQPYVSAKALYYLRFRALRRNVKEIQGSDYASQDWTSTYGLGSCELYHQLQGAFDLTGANQSLIPHQSTYNLAYSRFADKAKMLSAELATNFFERKEAISLILDRSVRILNAARAFRRFQISDGLRYLGLSGKGRSSLKHPKAWGDLWLEYWFGWSPLLSDIFTAIEVVDDPFGDLIRAKGSARFSIEYERNIPNIYESGISFDSETFRGELITCIQNDFRISDLTALKANQLGVINPFSVAWELIPFSFMADWFFPIGSWINQFSDFTGLTSMNPQFVHFIRGSGSYNKTIRTHSLKFDYDLLGVRRFPQIFGPSPFTPNLHWLSLTRAATSISLILSIFTPGGITRPTRGLL